MLVFYQTSIDNESERERELISSLQRINFIEQQTIYLYSIMKTKLQKNLLREEMVIIFKEKQRIELVQLDER